MRKRKLLSVFLCVTLLFLSLFVPSVSAATQGRITGSGVRMRTEPKTDNNDNVIMSLNKGTVVTINGTVKDSSDNTWYNVTYSGKTGYVSGKHVEEIAETFNPDFEANLANFPASYHAGLRAIHNAYPNWIFKADPVDMSLDEAINSQYSDNMFSTKKWVELTYGLEWRDPRVDQSNPAHIKENRWTFASRQTIGFFMDPRNALTVSAAKASFPNIFTFLLQTYDSASQKAEGLRTIVNGTFLNTDDYINIIMNAAAESGVSPYIIATTIITEQGTNGGSSLISGNYPGYEGYYNYFNYGATGDNVVVNGLEYAKSKGWNSPQSAIIGGAKQYGSGYVGSGQDTYYYMDFNVHGGSIHQYANGVYDQCVKAYYAGKAYVSNPFSALTFKIPVYSNMPDSVYSAPTMENYSPAVTTETPPSTSRRRGDYDGDGLVTVKELALIRMYLLGVRQLSAVECSYLDVTGDGALSVKDLATVRMYLLGLVSI
ncbi:MAG: SH3 domain-containing protein [Clostridia bacterium]|nr:SH3 domain-containing protein [Clostridia bacterium]